MAEHERLNMTKLPEVLVMGTQTEKPKAWAQVIAIFICSIAGLSCGMLNAWTSPSIPKIIRDYDLYQATEEQASYLTVISPISMILSSFIFPTMIDKIGRKRTILFVAIPHIISYALIGAAQSIYILYISRLVSGISDAGFLAAAPVYVGEISTPRIRGIWGNTLSFMFYLGQFLINVIGSYLTISLTGYVSLVIPITFLILFSLMPESPYYCLMKNRKEDARKSLQFLRRQKNVEDELISLTSDVNRQMSERGTWRDLFGIEHNRRALYAASFLRMSQQLSGLSVFTMYNQYIFAKAGGNLSPEVSSMIFFGLAAILNCIAGYCVDYIGRQKGTSISLLCCSFALLLEAIYSYINDFQPSVDLESFTWVPITGIILYSIFYSFGLGYIPTLMLGELFSTSIKGKALCYMNILYGIAMSTITKLFHFMATNYGMYTPFLFFAICSFVSGLVTHLIVPETKGKTLEEIQQDLRSRSKKKRTNSIQ